MNFDEILNYDNFTDDAKSIFNIAMDIYWNIKDIEIKKDVRDIYKQIPGYIFTKNDKKVISLYLSCFLADTNLKKKLNEYKDINVDSIISFMGIKRDNIKPLRHENYKSFYENNFKSILKDMLKSKENFFELKQIKSESIYFLMRNIKVAGSNILNYLSSEYTKEKFLCKHPSFEKIGKDILAKTYVYDDGNNEVIQYAKTKDDKFWFDRTYDHLYGTKIDEKSKLHISSETLRRFEIVLKRYVCQEKALNKLFSSIINNQFISRLNKGFENRSVIFLNGPSGTGKTSITKDLLENLVLPFYIVSPNNYFSFSDETNILKNLYDISYRNIEKAQTGVIVYDGSLRGDRVITKQALELLSGKTYKINVGSEKFPMYIDFDTSKLTFIFIDNVLKENSQKNIKYEDLVINSYDSKLVEKINTYIDTKRYSKEDFIAILNNSTISPILKLQNWVSSMNKTLKIDSDVIEKISTIAYDLGLEFNGLETLIYRMRTQLMGNVFFGKEKEIYLNTEFINSIYSNLNTERHI